MLYDRKIKYVDYYENGERVKGGGFVKLEVCDSILKMNLNIRGLHSTDSFVRDVVLRGSEKEAVLGQITLQEGAGSFNYSCELTEGIGGTGISYEELQEIKIPVGGSRELCCTWRNVSSKAAASSGVSKIESRKIESMETENPETVDLEPEAQEPEAQEPETQEPEAQEPEIQEPETQEPETLKQETETPLEETHEAEFLGEEPLQTEPLQTEPLQTEPRQAELRTSDSGSTEIPGKILRETKSIAKEPECQESAGKEQSSQEGKPVVKLMEDKWQQLSAIYPHIRPFQDEREYLSLSPSDFVMFPESYYRAANNSFLLHGFYNYKHLILARIELRGEARYYLGVPGNYYEREKQVAVMFGFESFECAREPAKTGDFGYYMMRMEL